MKTKFFIGIITVFILQMMPFFSNFTFANQTVINESGSILIRIEKDNVFVYKQASLSSVRLFSLHKSYYALARSINEDFYEISYAQNVAGYVPLTCYVAKSEVKIYAETPPEIIYPDIDAKCRQNSQIYETPDTSSQAASLLIKDQEVKIYGFITEKSINFAFVRIGSFFGYVPASDLTYQAVSLHPNPLPIPLGPPSDDFEPPATKELNKAVQIMLIFAILLPTIGIVYLSHKRQRE